MLVMCKRWHERGGAWQSTRSVDFLEAPRQSLMTHSFSPELRLAAACAMWPPSDRRAEAIRAAALGPLDWPRLLRVAKRHQVVALVHEGLRRLQTDVPLEIIEELGAQAAILVREDLALARESLRLQRLFDEADLPVLFVKGAALGVLTFGKLGLRSAQDIDLLVSYETLPSAIAIVRRAGYRRFDPPPNINDAQLRVLMTLRKDLGFIHEATGLRVELHWRLFLNPYAMVGGSMMSASRVVPLAGTVGLRTLSEENLFAYLCMHGALHWWYRLKWLSDINALFATMPEDRIEHLVQAAEERGAGRAASQALLLCMRVFRTHLPASLTATLDNSPKMRWLVATALNAMNTGQGEYDPHEVRFGTTRGSLSTILLSRNWRYRWAELGIQLTNPTDVLTLQLPQPLGFLYPILRLPLWVWRHTVQRNARRPQASTPASAE